MRRRIHNSFPAHIAAFVAVVALAVPITPAASGAGSPSSGDPAIMDAVQLSQLFVTLWNENKIDEIGARIFAEDAIVVPPNDEPIKGRANIVEYYKSLRPSLGELEEGLEHHRVVIHGDMTSLLGNYATVRPPLRFNSHEVYRRQPDGTIKLVHDMFGLSDRLK